MQTWESVFMAAIREGHEHQEAIRIADDWEHARVSKNTRPEGLQSGRRVEPVFDEDMDP